MKNRTLDSQNAVVLGIIPARKNSKRLPGKNIRELNGKPLISYTFDAARSAGSLDRVILSSDCELAAQLAVDAGIEVPFMRPAEISGDRSTDKDYLLHAVGELRDSEGFVPDYIVLLRPTTPLKTGNLIDDVVAIMKEKAVESVRTVTAVRGVHHPYWMFERDEDQLARPLIPGITMSTFYQSQLLPPVFRLNGVVDVIRCENLFQEGRIYGERIHLHEIPEQLSMDIDTKWDFELCGHILKAAEVKPDG